VVFDSYGRPVWLKDAGGFLHYTEYDLATGAVTKTITDVDTTRTTDFQNLPAGWVTPSGGGLHLLLRVEVDGLDRATKVTEPNGNVTYTVHKDVADEVRVYRGWQSSTNRPTGPTLVLREDHSNSYSEVLTMSAAPAVNGSGRPTGAEAISGVQSLQRSYVNAAGQVTHSDAYVNLSGLTYAISPTLGTENTHYYRTRYGYDSRGRRVRVQTPNGTIYRTVYDALDRTASA
jgi:YD repeat-containing protein